jgi:hypothetical protein
MGGDMSRTEGVLRLSDNCVVLENANDASELLVWSRERTAWDPGGRRVLLRLLNGSEIALADGQAVAIGGSGRAFSDDPGAREAIPWDEWIASVDWVAEPDPACEVDSYWAVGDVSVDP